MNRYLPSTRQLLVASAIYAAVWAVCFLVWRMSIEISWLVVAVFWLSLPLGGVWFLWTREQLAAGKLTRVAAAASGVYLFWWQLAVLTADALHWHAARAELAQYGAIGLFLIGLAWVVWWLERSSRRYEVQRIEERLAADPLLSAQKPPQPSAPRRTWNPLDPAAWYYGRGSQKLKQSLVGLSTYALLFWLCLALLSQVRGCRDIYEMPAGGGQQKTVAQTVRVQKVIRKKFIINPLSAIKFEVPPIDEVKLQLTEVTEHAYTIGYGEGTGAGFAGGTSRGKVRLIRLEYDGGDWNLNHGIGGDMNMLVEYGVLTGQKVSEQAESRRISQLAAFPPEKSPPVVFLTGQGSLSIANSEVKTLREYLLDKHGMLFASSGSSHFHHQFLAAMNRVLPDVRPVSVPLDDPIHRVPFLLPKFPYVVPHGGKEPLGWNVDGRWVAYYHPGDISDAWADGHAGVAPEIYNGCYQLGANVINYGHMEYAKWLLAKSGKK